MVYAKMCKDSLKGGKFINFFVSKIFRHHVCLTADLSFDATSLRSLELALNK